MDRLTKKQSLKEILSQKRPHDVWSHMDEVYPGIFVGGERAAKDVETLKRYEITHILNAANTTGLQTPAIGLGVLTTENFYENKGFPCKLLGVPALDYPGFDLSVYFHQAADFIERGLRNRGFNDGKVLVHCYMGVSRSATLVIAYLMIKQNMTAQEAVKQVRSKRCVIYPNDGFLDQICELEKKIFQA